MLKRIFGGVIKEIDTEGQTLTAVVSTGNVDRMGDIVDPEGVQLDNYQKNPVVLWAHNYDTPPVGRAMWIKKSAEGIVAKVQFAKTAFAREIFELFRGGFLNAFSIGFSPIESEPVEEGKDFGPKRYKKSEMLEFSAVPVPANPEALTMAVNKGILKTAAIKESFETYNELDTEPETETSAPTESFELKEFKEEKIDDAEIRIAELEDDIVSMMADVERLKEENDQLRYANYVLNQFKKKRLSEIAVDTFGEKIGEMVNGAIRKRLGKVD